MTPALLLALTFTITPGQLQFTNRVADYVEIHRQAAAGIEQPLCADPEELARQADALAAAIREARPRAREGDVFNLAVGEMFRARIASVVRRSNFDVAAFLAWHGGAEEGEDLDVQVNSTLLWPAHVALTTIVGDLPQLPPELEYRFVGRHLVLLDVGAHLVVDVLRDALPLSPARPEPPTPCHAHPELDACWM